MGVNAHLFLYGLIYRYNIIQAILIRDTNDRETYPLNLLVHSGRGINGHRVISILHKISVTVSDSNHSSLLPATFRSKVNGVCGRLIQQLPVKSGILIGIAA